MSFTNSIGEKRRKQEKYLLELTTSEGFIDPSDEGKFDGRKGHDVKIYSFDLIMVATNNFSDENKLGAGGFGPVYKVKSKSHAIRLIYMPM